MGRRRGCAVARSLSSSIGLRAQPYAGVYLRISPESLGVASSANRRSPMYASSGTVTASARASQPAAFSRSLSSHMIYIERGDADPMR